MPRKRNPESAEGGNDDKKKKKKNLDSKFGGMTEEEVMQRLLPDHLKADLDVIFVSSAYLVCSQCGDNDFFVFARCVDRY